MKPFRRADRVEALVLRELSQVLQKGIKDPRLKMVTITRVKLSSDLRFARIYFSCTSGQNGKSDVEAGFRTASGYLKRTLSERLDLRYMPELKFFYDESYDYASRIDRILNSLKTGNGTDHRQAEEK